MLVSWAGQFRLRYSRRWWSWIQVMAWASEGDRVAAAAAELAAERGQRAVLQAQPTVTLVRARSRLRVLARADLTQYGVLPHTWIERSFLSSRTYFLPRLPKGTVPFFSRRR